MDRLDGKELAEAVAVAVNSYGFDGKAFCSHMSNEHRTLQQSFTRLCIAWIRECAAFEDWQIDGRNEASVLACRKLTETLDANEIGRLPLV